MNPRYYKVPNSNVEEPDFDPGEWLSHHMEKNGMSDGALLKTIQDLGYEGGSRTTVANWRKGSSLIPPEVFPKICVALNFPSKDVDQMTCAILKDAYPDLKMFFRDPLQEKWDRIQSYLRGLGAERKKAAAEKLLKEAEAATALTTMEE